MVRSEALTAASMEMAVFWIVAQCNMAEVYGRFSTSETSVNFYHITLRNNPEDSHLQIRMVICLNITSVF
jgi:hypothetical protein